MPHDHSDFKRTIKLLRLEVIGNALPKNRLVTLGILHGRLETEGEESCIREASRTIRIFEKRLQLPVYLIEDVEQHIDINRATIRGETILRGDFTMGVAICTDHAAESVMGFFTKFGDSGANVLPLAGVNKRRVRALAIALGATEAIAHEVPTADLEMLRPQCPDEDA
jgi:hypothetical protein